MLGDRLSQTRIRKMIKAYDGENQFCPKCGCVSVKWVDHGVEYPERWVSGYCMRCNFHVIESDNSPYYHVLDCEGLSIY